MKYTNCKIAKEELFFWKENPRIIELNEQPRSEAELINILMTNEKSKELKKNIEEMGRIVEDFWVYFKDGKYVVYDGNRRLSCLKKISKDIDYSCRIYDTEIDVINDVASKHLGENNGVGQRKWKSLRIDRFRVNYQSLRAKYDSAYKFVEELEAEYYTKMNIQKHYTDKSIKEEVIDYSTLDTIIKSKYFFKYLTENGYIKTSILIKEYNNNGLNTRNGRSESEFNILYPNEKKVQIEESAEYKHLGLIKKKSNHLQGGLFDVNKITNEQVGNSNKFSLGDIPNKESYDGYKQFKDNENQEINSKADVGPNVYAPVIERNKPLRENDYQFLSYRSIGRPRIKDENLKNLLKVLQNENITNKNYRNHFSLPLIYRPFLEAHLHLLRKELMLKDVKNSDLNNLLSLKETNSMVSKKVLESIIKYGKSSGKLKKSEIEFDVQKCDKIFIKLHDIQHGKKFVVDYAELQEIDEYIKAIVLMIYKIIGRL